MGRPGRSGLTIGRRAFSPSRGRILLSPLLRLFCLVGVFGLLASCVRDAGLSVPQGWKRTGLSTWNLKDPSLRYDESVKALNDGLQSWRIDPAPAAAQCLLDFGAVLDTDPVTLSARLTVIEENSLYSFDVANERYFVTVRFYEDVPVAVQVRVAPVP